MPNTRLVPLLLSVSFVVWPAGIDAGQTRALQQRLAAVTSLECSFTVLATGTWTDGAPGVDVTKTTFTMGFANLNIDEGTAEATGRFGDVPVVVRYVNDYLHLMQMHSSGPLHTTTVIARTTTDGRLMAVHTRHEYTDVRLPGFTSRPEMYVGDCAVGE